MRRSTIPLRPSTFFPCRESMLLASHGSSVKERDKRCNYSKRIQKRTSHPGVCAVTGNPRNRVSFALPCLAYENLFDYRFCIPVRVRTDHFCTNRRSPRSHRHPKIRGRDRSRVATFGVQIRRPSRRHLARGGPANLLWPLRCGLGNSSPLGNASIVQRRQIWHLHSLGGLLCPRRRKRVVSPQHVPAERSRLPILSEALRSAR